MSSVFKAVGQVRSCPIIRVSFLMEDCEYDRQHRNAGICDDRRDCH